MTFGCTFQNNSALTVRSFINDMTLSELHCIFAGGFATVTGSMFAVYTGEHTLRNCSLLKYKIAF